MAIYLRTENAEAFFESVKEKLNNSETETWQWDQNWGCFFYKPDLLTLKPIFRISGSQTDLYFMLCSDRMNNTSLLNEDTTSGVFHGAFLEMLYRLAPEHFLIVEFTP